MLQNQALIPQIILKSENKFLYNILSIFSGVFLMSLLAQVTIPLPFTPVPITGQTFGVSLTALLWGRNRGCITLASYLALGALGLPVFAMGKSGLFLGPTTGYLIGMFFASYAMGALADLGWTKSFSKTWLAAFCGSIITFAFGLFGLAFFIPKQQLLMAGLIPFLPGDIIKTLFASALAWRSTRFIK